MFNITLKLNECKKKVYRKNKSVLTGDAEFLEQMNAYSDEEKELYKEYNIK